MECIQNLAIDSSGRRDRELETVKDEVLNLSDKFDFFIASLIKNGLIKHDADSKEPLMSFSNSFGGPNKDSVSDPEGLRIAFNSFQRNALESNLGDRQALRLQSVKKYQINHLKRWVEYQKKLKEVLKDREGIKRRSNSFISEL